MGTRVITHSYRGYRHEIADSRPEVPKGVPVHSQISIYSARSNNTSIFGSPMSTVNLWLAHPAYHHELPVFWLEQLKYSSTLRIAFGLWSKIFLMSVLVIFLPPLAEGDAAWGAPGSIEPLPNNAQSSSLGEAVKHLICPKRRMTAVVQSDGQIAGMTDMLPRLRRQLDQPFSRSSHREGLKASGRCWA